MYFKKPNELYFKIGCTHDEIAYEGLNGMKNLYVIGDDNRSYLTSLALNFSEINEKVLEVIFYIGQSINESIFKDIYYSCVSVIPNGDSLLQEVNRLVQYSKPNRKNLFIISNFEDFIGHDVQNYLLDMIKNAPEDYHFIIGTKTLDKEVLALIPNVLCFKTDEETSNILYQDQRACDLEDNHFIYQDVILSK